MLELMLRGARTLGFLTFHFAYSYLIRFFSLSVWYTSGLSCLAIWGKLCLDWAKTFVRENRRWWLRDLWPIRRYSSLALSSCLFLTPTMVWNLKTLSAGDSADPWNWLPDRFWTIISSYYYLITISSLSIGDLHLYKNTGSWESKGFESRLYLLS